MDSSKKVAVIGCGSWGTAVANVFADAGSEVLIWGRDKNVIDGINQRHENLKYLAGIALSKQLKGTTNLLEAVRSAEIVVCGIPTQQIRQVFAPLGAELTGKIIVNTSKGIELGTYLRVSEIFKDIAPLASYAILSGPTFAAEVARRLPAAITLGCDDRDLGERIQKLLSTPYFRVYTCRDIPGVELGGALKNIVAIATGLANGLQLGYNAQAAIIDRGIAEIMRMAQKLGGAEPLTFLGLSGMGDLILTCTGPLSRNRTVGIKLGEGKKLDDIVRELGGVAEGVYTARSAYELVTREKIDMPITEQIYKILYENRTPQQAVRELMSRDLKEEWDVS